MKHAGTGNCPSNRILTSAGSITVSGRGIRQILQEFSKSRWVLIAALAAILIAVCPHTLTAEGSPQAPATQQQDNPFPTEPNKAATKPTSPVSGQTPTPATPPQTGDNPFPGEGSNAPILPVDSQSTSSSANSSSQQATDSGSAADLAPDPNGDPVRSPDSQVGEDDGFSSSRSGLKPALAENDADVRPGHSTKTKTREQVLKEDVDIGSFYLERKNWRAALARFEAAYALNPEEPTAVWGLAEAERHLQLFDKARAHYELFLIYDPEGPRSREARKALQQVGTSQPLPGSSEKH